MCMICVDEVVVAAGIAIVAIPWYKAIWHKICKRDHK